MIYFDNAATTAIDQEVLEAMEPWLYTNFGNPSSLYSIGRTSRIAIEEARKQVASLLGAHPGEILFTSCGTESNNTGILSAIRDIGCSHIISSPIEHHAVLNTVRHYHEWLGASLSFVALAPDGSVIYENLEKQLREQKVKGNKCLVSLMHANNEIGTVTDIEIVGKLCEQYDAISHSDCVQTVGHYPIDLNKQRIHFLSASAHKFHGPKGIGVLYINSTIQAKPLLYGGGQERQMRAGTENVAGIIGFAKALEIAMNYYEDDRKAVTKTRDCMIVQLDRSFKDVSFNGDVVGGLYTVLSVSFPKNERTEDLLFELDAKHICVSGGSACSGGASHVMKYLGRDKDFITLRFSFSKYNGKEEVHKVITLMKDYLLVGEKTGEV
jgi:cysteine desulfurase